MQKVIDFILKYRLLLLLLVISMISHWYIVFDFRYLNAGDWIYVPNILLSELMHYGQWNAHSGLGEVIALSPNLVFYWIASMLLQVSSVLTWDVFTRLFFLAPVAFLTPLFSFMLFNYIFKNRWMAFFSASVYCFNTFFLKLQLDWLTYASVWWILPASLLSVMKYFDTGKKRYLIGNATLFFFALVFEIRIAILLLAILMLYQIVRAFYYKEETITRSIKDLFIAHANVFSTYLIGLIGHLFWILPFIFSSLSQDVLNNAATNPFTALFNIMDALTLHSYQWKNNLVLESFVHQNIDFRHFLIPIFFFIGIYLIIANRYKLRQKHYFTFFGSMTILFLLFSKQSFSPLTALYNWMFYSVPLFNLYRESSKFFIGSALSISFFFGIGFFHLFNKIREKLSDKMAYSIIFLLLFFSTFYNLQHFIDQKIGGMTSGITMQHEYRTLENYLSLDKTFSRVLWMPTKSRFGFYSQYHPVVNAADLIALYTNETHFVIFGSNLLINDQLTYLFNQNFSSKQTSEFAIRYVIVPMNEPSEKTREDENQEITFVDNVYESYGKREIYLMNLDKLSYLKRIDIGTEELVVYENENYRPHIYTTKEKETIQKEVSFEKVDFHFKNPTEYSIRLKNISEPVYVNFSEKYHPDWKMRVGSFRWLDVLTKKDYFLSDSFHSENDAKLNSFLIDPVYIKKNFTKDEYHENPDGSIDLELTLYFKPQSYFYLGLIISGTTLVLCLGYLGFTGIRSLRRKSLK